MIEINIILFVLICVFAVAGLIAVLVIVVYVGDYFYKTEIENYNQLEKKYLANIKELRQNNSMLLTELRKEKEINKFKGDKL